MKQFYQMECEETLQLLETKQAGLSQTEVLQRQERYGKNVLEEVKAKPIWQIFLAQFKDLLVIILIVAGIISMISGEVESTIVILSVITLNAFLGTYQSVKAQKSLDALKQLSTPHTRIMRDGETMEVKSSELTVGDIMLLEAGDVVGADARIIENYSLQVNESALTGEVESVEKAVRHYMENVHWAIKKTWCLLAVLSPMDEPNALSQPLACKRKSGKLPR